MFGTNTIPPPKSKSLLERIGDEFKDTLVRILLCVAVVSAGFSYLEVRWRDLPARWCPSPPYSPLTNPPPHPQPKPRAQLKESTHDGASAGLKVFVEPAVIMFILVMNAAVGVKMGMGAEASLNSLNSLNPALTTLLRFSSPQPSSAAKDIVPGDVVLLKTGAKIPADCRILKINGGRLGCDESALTGETDTVEKTSDEIEDATDLPLQVR